MNTGGNFRSDLQTQSYLWWCVCWDTGTTAAAASRGSKPATGCCSETDMLQRDRESHQPQHSEISLNLPVIFRSSLLILNTAYRLYSCLLWAVRMTAAKFVNWTDWTCHANIMSGFLTSKRENISQVVMVIMKTPSLSSIFNLRTQFVISDIYFI